MPTEIRETTIDGVTYRVELLGGDVAFDAYTRFGFAMSGKMDRADVAWLKKEMAERTQVGVVDSAIVDGVERASGRVVFHKLAPRFDQHFGGGPAGHTRMLAWFQFALEANFGPFVDVVRAILRILRGPSSSTSPKTAPGSSGDSSPTPAAA